MTDSPMFDFDYFLAETAALRELWSRKDSWIGFGNGDSPIERAFHGWFHLSVSCLDAKSRDRASTITEATIQEYGMRAMMRERMPTHSPGSIRQLDALCEGEWADMPPEDRAFNIGFVDADNGDCRRYSVPVEFRGDYDRGQEAWEDSL